MEFVSSPVHLTKSKDKMAVRIEIICDFCKEKIDTKNEYVRTYSSLLGRSTIELGGEKDKPKCCGVGNQHFCNLDCMFSNIKEELDSKKKKVRHCDHWTTA